CNGSRAHRGSRERPPKRRWQRETEPKRTCHLQPTSPELENEPAGRDFAVKPRPRDGWPQVGRRTRVTQSLGRSFASASSPPVRSFGGRTECTRRPKA